jgi:hypothetical protein
MEFNDVEGKEPGRQRGQEAEEGKAEDQRVGAQPEDGSKQVVE